MNHLDNKVLKDIENYIKNEQDFSISFLDYLPFSQLESYNEIQGFLLNKEPSYFSFDNFIDEFNSYIDNNLNLLDNQYGINFEKTYSNYIGREFVRVEELENQKLYDKNKIEQPKQIIREVVDESLLPYNYSNNYDTDFDY